MSIRRFRTAERQQGSQFHLRSSMTEATGGNIHCGRSIRAVFRRFVSGALIALLAAGSVGTESAEAQQGAWRLTYQDRNGADLQVTTEFETREQAEAWMQNLAQDNAQSRGLGLKPNYFNFQISQGPATDIPANRGDRQNETSGSRPTLKEIRRMIQSGKGRVGNNVKEYSQLLKEKIGETTAARSKLMKTTGDIERRTFDQVNDQINAFNQDVQEYNKLIQSPEIQQTLRTENGGVLNPQDLEKVEIIPTVSPEQLQGNLSGSLSGSPPNLVGKKGTGRFGQFRVRIEFRENDKVVIYGADAPTVVMTSGTYRLTGNTISIDTKIYHYEGTVNGNKVSGTRTEQGKGVPENWSVTLGDDRSSDDTPQGETRALSSFSSMYPARPVASAATSQEPSGGTVYYQQPNNGGNDNYGNASGNQTRHGGLDWNAFNAMQRQSNAMTNSIMNRNYGGGRPSYQPRSPQFNLPRPSNFYVPGTGGGYENKAHIRMDESRPYSR